MTKGLTKEEVLAESGKSLCNRCSGSLNCGRETALNGFRKKNERVSTMPFLLWHFSPGNKIENCSAQFLAVCWIVRVEFKVHRPQQADKNLVPVAPRCRSSA